MIRLARMFLLLSLAFNLAWLAKVFSEAKRDAAATSLPIAATAEKPRAGLESFEETLSPPVARALARATIEEKFSQERLRLLKTQPALPYWRLEYERPISVFGVGNLRADFQALAREESEALGKLGPPESTDFDPREILAIDRQVGDWPEPQRLAYYQAVKRNWSEPRASLPAPDLATSEQAARDFQASVARDLQGVLTPAQFAEIQLRSDDTLKRELARFPLTEAEFRRIAALAKDTHSLDRIDPEKLKAALGAARYEQMRFALDPANSLFVRLANRVNLPIETAIAARDLEQAALAEWNAVRKIRPATRATREKANEIRRETTRKFKELLGEEGYGLYEQTSGLWLKVP